MPCILLHASNPPAAAPCVASYHKLQHILSSHDDNDGTWCCHVTKDAVLMTGHVPAATCGSPAAHDFFWVQLLDAVITAKG